MTSSYSNGVMYMLCFDYGFVASWLKKKPGNHFQPNLHLKPTLATECFNAYLSSTLSSSNGQVTQNTSQCRSLGGNVITFPIPVTMVFWRECNDIFLATTHPSNQSSSFLPPSKSVPSVCPILKSWQRIPRTAHSQRSLPKSKHTKQLRIK
jgi:hypothetical protein